ncbi:unnamed protein product [Schistosoma margrebowiei]|uniref:Uncharacterized protein n=1 Tax=Schistosoma margrebowiei TaxID=48269 RepID=A0A183M968_9TREM|nr:unnamed protein product [Schistosoma margrebowiei]
MEAGDQQLVHSPFVPAGYWSPCALLVWNPVKAPDIRFSSSHFRKQHHRHEKASRLPCGIDSIRPHLENVDNVPLQVSLFTDCTPKAVSEMIQIMKEYGDTICLIGSCYSLTNYALFQQSDVAIAVKPILPYSNCQFANTKYIVSNQVSSYFL